MHRATSVYEPIPLDDFSSRHRHVAVHGGGEAHSLLASDVQADRDVLLARCEIAEAYYGGGDSLALDMLASSSLRASTGTLLPANWITWIYSMICRNALQTLVLPHVTRMMCRRPSPTAHAHMVSHEYRDRHQRRTGPLCAETGEKIQISPLPGDGSHKPEGLACAGTAGGGRRQRLVRHSRLRQISDCPGSRYARGWGQGVARTPGETRRSAVCGPGAQTGGAETRHCLSGNAMQLRTFHSL